MPYVLESTTDIVMIKGRSKVGGGHKGHVNPPPPRPNTKHINKLKRVKGSKNVMIENVVRGGVGGLATFWGCQQSSGSRYVRHQ